MQLKVSQTKKRSKSKSPILQNPFDKPLKTYNKFKKTLLPVWVGKLRYPKEVDYMPDSGSTAWCHNTDDKPNCLTLTNDNFIAFCKVSIFCQNSYC